MRTTTEHGFINARRVRGTAVYDKAGERIGTVNDLVINKKTGEIAYAVMSFGGFLGIGERYSPLPWDVLSYDVGYGGYRVSANGESFADAPHFEPAAMEQMEWDVNRVDEYYAHPERLERFGRRPGDLRLEVGSDLGDVTEGGLAGRTGTYGGHTHGGATGSIGTGGMTGDGSGRQ